MPQDLLCISRTGKFTFLFLLSLSLFAETIYGQSPPTQNKDDIILLEVKKPVERGFVRAENRHLFEVDLAANQYLKINIDQRGIDISARVRAASGDLIAEVNSENTAQGTETIELVAQTDEHYRIEIVSAIPALFSAGKYSIVLSETHQATADEKSLDEARRQYYRALRFNDEGNFDQALEAAKSSLETREKISGASQADTAFSLVLLGRIDIAKNELDQAEQVLRRAEELTAKVFGKENLNYADVLHFLARLRAVQRKFDEARQLNEQSLAVSTKIMGAESYAASRSTGYLATLYRAMNNYPEAEKYFRQTLSIREKTLGENNLETGVALNDFGLFYYGAGDFINASALLQRSLAAKEKSLPPNHWQIGIALNNLGLVEWKRENYIQAEADYERALKIFEIANGSESEGIASISHNLGIIYKEDGKYAEAEKYYKRALAIWEKVFGENYQSTATAVSSLAILYRNLGDYERAEKYQLRAEAIYENVLGEYNHYTLLSLGSLVKVYVSKGDINQAVEYMKRLENNEDKVLPFNILIGSERQKIAYFNQLERLDRFIALHAKNAPDNKDARDLAVTAVLQRKGRILDALSQNISALQQRFNPQDQLLLKELNDVTTQLSRSILNGKQNKTPGDYQSQIKKLELQKENLESEIGRRSAGFYQSTQPLTLAAVKAAIPADAALIEFAVYHPYNFKGNSDEKNYGEPRYIAYILRRGGETQWKDLGDAKTIDAAIDEWRKALRDPQRKDVQKLARAADEKIMQPLRALAADVKKFLISPDGELSLIPFEALSDEQNHYLIENYSFNYLTSGRDLLRMQTVRESKNNSLLIADPQFGANDETTADSGKTEKTSSGKTERRSVTATRSLSDTYFAPLGATLAEARSIQNLFPDATLLSEAEATETALKKANAPRILHIATHGFFLENNQNISEEKPAAADDTKTKPEDENPLLRSGLAFAGANNRVSGKSDDGILTALEASGLNLWGTKLVVLSACDTGLGQVKNGEGVYGLRRSFTLAGTETLVMSLWSVSDYTTRELMTNYYKNLKAGMGRGAALREVQLQMLKKKNRAHPFYWAAFIQSGEWANLDGKR